MFPAEFQFESALTIDAITTIRHALSKMAHQHPEVFRRNDGKVNGSEMIDCDAEPVKPWTIGEDVMKYIREVSKNTICMQMCLIAHIAVFCCFLDDDAILKSNLLQTRPLM